MQEELDWDIIVGYGLITDEASARLVANGNVPKVKLGERAFEIVLARRVERGEVETRWFTQHRSTPITEIPEHWPEEYRQVVARRIEVIEGDRHIGLIERPECKRRWQSEPWEDKEQAALKTWLLDRCEERSLWFGADGEPVPMTVNRLADRLRTDADVVSVARLLRGADADLGDVLKEIIAEEHVPFLAQYRYKPSGLDKRRQWERTWDLQREEDATGKKLDIDVPPKYAGADFQKQSYWRHRGKLDVPKERFISYPDASPDSDPNSLLIGWAGWDHREQAAAADHADPGAFGRRRLGHAEADGPAGRPPGGHALGPPVARRGQPGLRHELRRRLRRLPDRPARKPLPNRRRPP